MTTQYTTILKLALPVQGELSGSWGDVVNDNITEMVEEAVAGLATINSWTANSHTLTSANGTTSESRCAVLVADDDGGGNPSAAATIICPAASKLYVLKNISGQQVTLKTSAGTGVAVANGSTAFLFCDGTNVESCQTDIVGATTIDTTNLEVTNIKAKDGTASGSIANSTGVFTINSAVLTTADINGGTIDGVTIGGASSGAGTFSTMTTSNAAITGGSVTGITDLAVADGGTGAGTASGARTNLGVAIGSDVQAYDADLTAIAALAKTDGNFIVGNGSTWVAESGATARTSLGLASGATTTVGTIATQNANSVNIDGGAIDGTTIGGSSAAAGTFTTLSSTGNTTLGDATGDTVTVNGTVQPGVIVSGSSSGDAVRITQTGAGNALVVEDSANPDSTPFIVEASGKVGVGTTAPTSPFNVQRNGTPVSGSASTAATFQSTSATTQSTYVSLIAGSSGSTGQAAIHFGDADDVDIGQVLYRNSENSMDFVVNTASCLKIESDGGVKVVKAAFNPITTDNDLSFDQAASNNFKSTPSGSGTLTFTNHTDGQTGNVLLINTGGHAISLAATTKGDANLATTISTAGTYWLSYYDDGTNAYVTTSAAFA